MKVIIRNWKHIDEVPYLIYEWAKLVSGGKITVSEINELVNEYEEYLHTHDNKS